MPPPLRLRLLPVLASTLVALAAGAGVAQAASTVKVKGQVVGTPYASGSKTAIPVLLTQGSVKKARLKSPLGVAIVPRSKRVRIPGGTSRPGSLRIGDSFRGSTRASKTARSAVYPRLTVKGLSVTKRSKTLSLDELSKLVTALRSDLNKLSANVSGLTSFTLSNFAAVRADIAGIRSALAALRADVDALKGQFTSLSASLATLQSTLEGAIGDLANLGPLSTQLTTALADIASLQSTVGSLLTRMTSAESAIATLTATLGSLGTTVGGLTTSLASISSRVTAVEGLLTGLAPGDLSGALSSIATLQSKVLSLTGQLAGVDGVLGNADDTLTTLSGTVSTLTGTTVPAIQGTVTGLQGTVSGLTTTTSGLTTSVATLTSGARRHECLPRNADHDGERPDHESRLTADDRLGAGRNRERRQRPRPGRRRAVRAVDPRDPARRGLLAGPKKSEPQIDPGSGFGRAERGPSRKPRKSPLEGSIGAGSTPIVPSPKPRTMARKSP